MVKKVLEESLEVALGWNWQADFHRLIPQRSLDYLRRQNNEDSPKKNEQRLPQGSDGEIFEPAVGKEHGCHRHGKRGNRQPLSGNGDHIGNPLTNIIENEERLEREKIEEDLCAALISGIAALNENERELITHIIEGGTPKDYAKIIGLTSNAVRQRLSTVRIKLKKMIDPRLIACVLKYHTSREKLECILGKQDFEPV